ncbi:MAG: VWA domain-containing protein [Paludibacteraceae bacterium]|nr:VWA domain-containing protein [Paludibacteraceae bacterium]
MENQQGLKYNVDLVFVVDTTGSMANLINTVKGNILKFYPDLKKVADEKGKSISQFRIKVIDFKNYEYNGRGAIQESKFFTLTNDAQMENEEDQLQSYVNNLSANGGSGSREQGYRENGLEALTIAMRSDWDKGGDKRRHVIVLFTDIAPLTFEEGRKYAGDNYPQDMPANFDELTDMWDSPQGAVMAKSSKRLILFAPDCETWDNISNNWNEVIHWPAKAGEGLSDADYNTILDTLMNSI